MSNKRGDSRSVPGVTGAATPGGNRRRARAPRRETLECAGLTALFVFPPKASRSPAPKRRQAVALQRTPRAGEDHPYSGCAAGPEARLTLKNVRRITLRVSREANFTDVFWREGGERGDGASTLWNEEVSGCLCLTPSAPSASSAVNFFWIGVGLFLGGGSRGRSPSRGCEVEQGHSVAGGIRRVLVPSGRESLIPSRVLVG